MPLALDRRLSSIQNSCLCGKEGMVQVATFPDPPTIRTFTAFPQSIRISRALRLVVVSGASRLNNFGAQRAFLQRGAETAVGAGV